MKKTQHFKPVSDFKPVHGLTAENLKTIADTLLQTINFNVNAGKIADILNRDARGALSNKTVQTRGGMLNSLYEDGANTNATKPITIYLQTKDNTHLTYTINNTLRAILEFAGKLKIEFVTATATQKCKIYDALANEVYTAQGKTKKAAMINATNGHKYISNGTIALNTDYVDNCPPITDDNFNFIENFDFNARMDLNHLTPVNNNYIVVNKVALNAKVKPAYIALYQNKDNFYLFSEKMFKLLPKQGKGNKGNTCKYYLAPVNGFSPELSKEKALIVIKDNTLAAVLFPINVKAPQDLQGLPMDDTTEQTTEQATDITTSLDAVIHQQSQQSEQSEQSEQTFTKQAPLQALQNPVIKTTTDNTTRAMMQSAEYKQTAQTDKNAPPPPAVHINGATGKPYNGANIKILENVYQNKGYTRREWYGYHQARKKNMRPKDDAQGVIINIYRVDDDTGQVFKSRETVYNIADLEQNTGTGTDTTSNKNGGGGIGAKIKATATDIYKNLVNRLKKQTV